MKKIITIFLAMTSISLITLAQTYELNQVEQIPTLDKKNMLTIAYSVKELFDEAIKDPLKNSTVMAASETIDTYINLDDGGKLIKSHPRNGKQYALTDSVDLKKNQFNTYVSKYGEKEPKISLLFNLNFDENGKLLVPDKIFVVLYRTEDVKDKVNDRTTIEKLGLLSFELTIPDSIKNKLNKVKLQNLAMKDGNSLTGELSPVSIKLPFNLSYGSYKEKEINGQVIKRGEQIGISIGRNFNGREEEEHFIALLKEKTKILEYKSGDFKFKIEKNTHQIAMEINILESNMFVNRNSKTSSQAYSYITEDVTKFSGEGKKVKK